MLRLPNELLRTIVSMLDTGDIWTISRVCARLRGVSVDPLLARYAIRKAHLECGELQLTRAQLAPIPLVSSMVQIRRLVILFTAATLDLRRLGGMLATLPLIPDIVIYNDGGLFSNTNGVAELIVSLSRGKKFVVVQQGTVRVSEMSRIPLFPLAQLGTGILSIGGALRMAFLPAALSLLFGTKANYIAGIGNLLVGILFISNSVASIRHHTSIGIVGHVSEEIMQAVGPWKDWMRLKQVSILGTSDIALLTFGPFLDQRLVIARIPSISRAQYATLLATLDLTQYLDEVAVVANCGLSLSDVICFVHRHCEVAKLTLEPHSLSSIIPQPHLSPCAGVAAITAPAAYVAALVPLLPRLERIHIDCSDSADNLSRALAALGGLPGTAPLSLTLNFAARRVTSASELMRHLRALFARSGHRPWHTTPLQGAALPRVVQLTLRAGLAAPSGWRAFAWSQRPSPEAASADIAALAIWLVHSFPGLRELAMRHRALTDPEAAHLVTAFQHRSPTESGLEMRSTLPGHRYRRLHNLAVPGLHDLPAKCTTRPGSGGEAREYSFKLCKHDLQALAHHRVGPHPAATVPNSPPPPVPPSSCQCCTSVPSSSAAASAVAALVGSTSPASSSTSGSAARPSVVGNNCGGTVVTCDAPAVDSEWGGLIAINCVPVTL
ncbi:hypothetical protein GGX14DRAFT_653584 [Mycena pura]|uniref:F-box domain-containing protein n=1 Tax=Mycena pura TaxID=153505 RepID=A0AAD6V4V1_9AGAR|nr:hypothetical protein GGX14DRAFT_653584 [Mycena pura]